MEELTNNEQIVPIVTAPAPKINRKKTQRKKIIVLCQPSSIKYIINPFVIQTAPNVYGNYIYLGECILIRDKDGFVKMVPHGEGALYDTKELTKIGKDEYEYTPKKLTASQITLVNNLIDNMYLHDEAKISELGEPFFEGHWELGKRKGPGTSFHHDGEICFPDHPFNKRRKLY
jgi:hypothetical protein